MALCRSISYKPSKNKAGAEMKADIWASAGVKAQKIANLRVAVPSSLVRPSRAFIARLFLLVRGRLQQVHSSVI